MTYSVGLNTCLWTVWFVHGGKVSYRFTGGRRKMKCCWTSIASLFPSLFFGTDCRLSTSVSVGLVNAHHVSQTREVRGDNSTAPASPHMSVTNIPANFILETSQLLAVILTNRLGDFLGLFWGFHLYDLISAGPDEMDHLPVLENLGEYWRLVQLQVQRSDENTWELLRSHALWVSIL